MSSITYRWGGSRRTGEFTLVRVPGTQGVPYTFGDSSASIAVDVAAFWIGVVPITQGFCEHVAGPAHNPAIHRGSNYPVENISWDGVTQPGGFLSRLNASAVATTFREQLGESFMFRLPSETEWEYAARGGPAWRDGYRYSGSNDVDSVAWYDRIQGDETKSVAMKAPNQLGLYDMSGNIWEWCQDTFVRDVQAIPVDGTPHPGPENDRVLRGGCFHSWAVHCTVAKRYEIARNFHDGCIGFRVVFAEPHACDGV